MQKVGKKCSLAFSFGVPKLQSPVVLHDTLKTLSMIGMSVRDENPIEYGLSRRDLKALPLEKAFQENVR